MASWLQDIYFWLRFSSEAASLLVREHRLESPESLKVLTDENVDDICNVMRRPGGKNADDMHDRGQQISVIVQETG